MIILNFSHPLTEAQKMETAKLAGQEIEAVYDVHVQFENGVSYAEQAAKLMSALPLDAVALQTEAILVVLPSSNFIAAEALAWLHGIMGYFPAVLRLAPEEGHIPPLYHAAEILNLQSARDEARRHR